MAGIESDVVLCCFSGEWISRERAVQLTLSIGEDGETQVLFADPKYLAQAIHPDVPLHPDIWSDR